MGNRFSLAIQQQTKNGDTSPTTGLARPYACKACGVGVIRKETRHVPKLLKKAGRLNHTNLDHQNHSKILHGLEGSNPFPTFEIFILGKGWGGVKLDCLVPCFWPLTSLAERIPQHKPPKNTPPSSHEVMYFFFVPRNTNRNTIDNECRCQQHVIYFVAVIFGGFFDHYRHPKNLVAGQYWVARS